MSAVISKCGKYRYWLQRDSLFAGPSTVFLMHNPSTADATHDDPTLRRCADFNEGGKLCLVNLFAGRATKPADLWKMDDPIGAENFDHIKRAIEEIHYSKGKFIIGFGALNFPRKRENKLFDHVYEVCELIRLEKIKTWCLGETQDGWPRHPLYVKADKRLQRWNWNHD